MNRRDFLKMTALGSAGALTAQKLFEETASDLSDGEYFDGGIADGVIDFENFDEPEEIQEAADDLGWIAAGGAGAYALHQKGRADELEADLWQADEDVDRLLGTQGMLTETIRRQGQQWLDENSDPFDEQEV